MNGFIVSIDVESDGPIPGENSMLSLGAAAFDTDGELIDVFQANLKPLEGAHQDPETMAWWEKNKEAWDYALSSQAEPEKAMKSFDAWLRILEARYGTVTFIAYPAGYDWTFVYWYSRKFIPVWKRGFQCLDIKSYAAALLGVPFRSATKRNFPKVWFNDNFKHTHKASDDAVEQGYIYFQMLQWAKNRG